VVLDGSGSTSGRSLAVSLHGRAGRQATAILQSATDPKATIEFVDGPGLYLIQLTVTDASGNSAKSAVITLNYQSS